MMDNTDIADTVLKDDKTGIARATKLLESERADDRRRAAKILAQMGDDRAVAPLFKAVGDADAEVAGTALWALGKRPEAVRPLVEAALCDEIYPHCWESSGPQVEAALRKTRHRRWESSGPRVEAALSEMDRRSWRSALRYLIAYPDTSRESLIAPLFRIAADANIEIAQMAVQVLGQMQAAVRPVVEAALRGTDRRRRKSAFRYLAMQPQDLLGKEIPWDWKKALGSEMVYVPPGPFEMGSDREGDPLAGDDEVPRHQVTLPGYWIGKAPVTAAQFRPFVQAIKDRMLLIRRNQWYGYHWFDSTPFKELQDDSSVVGVSWDDAALYCYLLSRSNGLTVMLPSEAEWEKAKQGTAGQLPDVDVSLTGNVWEWTRSLWGRNQDSPDFKYPYDPYDGRESLEVYGLRVVRGWTKRLGRYPYVRDESLGFRLVLSPYSISDFWFLPEAGV